MPSISNKHCPRHGVYHQKRCPKCSKKIMTPADDRQKSVYNKAIWAKVKFETLVRDRHRCVKCGVRVDKEANDHDTDHIIELKDGGAAYDLDNLQTLCKSCHKNKTDEEKAKRNYSEA